MDGSLLLWMTLATSLFWGVGVFNRLMRMRARGLSALGSVEKHMRLYADLVREQVTLRDPGVAHGRPEHSPDQWDRLLLALQTLEQVLRDDRARTLVHEPLALLADAFDGVQTAWRQLHDVPPDLAGPIVPVALHAQWEAVAQRVETARGGFNEILTKYNEALEQFPARLVVGSMGFKPGGKL